MTMTNLLENIDQIERTRIEGETAEQTPPVENGDIVIALPHATAQTTADDARDPHLQSAQDARRVTLDLQRR